MVSGINSDNLTAAFIDNVAVIRVEGRGSFKISPSMKQFIHQVIDGHSAQRILIDMAPCIGMDSTFMGVVAGISCYIKSKPEVQFRLINLSEKNQKLLTTLGVDRVVDYSLAGSGDEQAFAEELSADGQPIPANPDDKLSAATTSLKAHQALVDINPENYAKFKAVVEYLKDDVASLKRK